MNVDQNARKPKYAPHGPIDARMCQMPMEKLHGFPLGIRLFQRRPVPCVPPIGVLDWF